jgi:hypothetical protein
MPLEAIVPTANPKVGETPGTNNVTLVVVGQPPGAVRVSAHPIMQANTVQSDVPTPEPQGRAE